MFVTCHTRQRVLCLIRLVTGTVVGRRGVGRRGVVVLVKVGCGRLALVPFESVSNQVDGHVCHSGLVELLLVVVGYCCWLWCEDGKDGWNEEKIVWCRRDGEDQRARGLI